MKKTIFHLIIVLLLGTGADAGMVDEFMNACEKGSMQGCYQSGVVYWTGEGAEKDREAARSLLNISCNGGFEDACVALQTFYEEEKSVSSSGTKSLQVPERMSVQYRGYIDGRLQGDIDGDGKNETLAWKKFATGDFGDYYQLLVLDDDGSLLWKGSEKKDEGDPLVFFSLDFGVSLPEILIDFDHDGFMELLAPSPQSEVSPTYYRKLRWRGTYFEPLASNALMLSYQGSNRFIWKATSNSYGTWISKLLPYGNGLVKADVMEYTKNQSVNMGTALIRFDREGAAVERWIKPMPVHNMRTVHQKSLVKYNVMGIVHGLDPYGDGFLSIRKKPNAKEIGRLYNGDKVEILGKKGKWLKIRAVRSDTVGWSHSNWIRTY